jgi:hypothetical protein
MRKFAAASTFIFLSLFGALVPVLAQSTPIITFDSAFTDLTVAETSKVTVSGTVQPPDTRLRLFLNNTVITENIIPDSDGRFSYELDLVSGTNEIEVTDYDDFVARRAAEHTITHGAELPIIPIVLVAGAVLTGALFLLTRRARNR